MLLMWLGEQITDRGIGNGVSLVITIGILARLPQCRAGCLSDMFSTQGGTREPLHNFWTTRARTVGAAGRRGGRRHRHHPGPAQNPGAIRQPHDRPEDVCQAALLHAPARELFRRHAHHLRPVHPDVPAADLYQSRRLDRVRRPVSLEILHSGARGMFNTVPLPT